MVKEKRPRDRATRNETKHLWWWIATWFGCGMSPFMSGTVSSLGSLPFAYVIQSVSGNNGLFAAAVLMFIAGTWATNCYLRHYGRNDDPGEACVDEVHGQWLILAFMPFTWQSYLIGFIVFRIFDIIKPWPICVADRKIHGGFGVMFDDTLAALYPVLIYGVLNVLGVI